jgi:diacylglycerol kinase (ATP)
MKQKVLFIINPIAGHRKAPAIIRYLELSAVREIFDVSISHTEYRSHGIELSAKAADEGFHAVIAVGGDGTVNETARPLIGKETALGIIPAGSGNGLARHLEIPADPKQAIERICRNRITRIDTMEVNDRLSLNVSGFGFDGYVAWLFDQSKKRGLGGYTKIALKEYFKYKSVEFKVKLDDVSLDKTAHMIVIANASQFGNAAVIAPAADLKDGLIDIIVVKRPPVYKMPALFYRLFSGKLKSNENTLMFTTRTMIAVSDRPVHLHIDGEPSEPVNEIKCTINPLSLNVIS